MPKLASAPAGQSAVVECRAPLGREELSAVDSEKIAAMFKALSDPVRLRLFSRIAAQPGGEACVCEIQDVGVARPSWLAAWPDAECPPNGSGVSPETGEASVSADAETGLGLVLRNALPTWLRQTGPSHSGDPAASRPWRPTAGAVLVSSAEQMPDRQVDHQRCDQRQKPADPTEPASGFPVDRTVVPWRLDAMDWAYGSALRPNVYVNELVRLGAITIGSCHPR